MSSVPRIPAPIHRSSSSTASVAVADVASYFPPVHLDPTNALGLSSDTDYSSYSPLASSDSSYSSSLPSSSDPYSPWPAHDHDHDRHASPSPSSSATHAAILRTALDDTVRTLNAEWDEPRIQDLLACIDRVHLLLQDVTENTTLRPIVDDGAGDVALWNKHLAVYFDGKDFTSAPPHVADAYTSRRLHACFSTSRYFKTYDPFFRRKCEAFACAAAGGALLPLADGAVGEQPGYAMGEQPGRREVFMRLARLCLWGTAVETHLDDDDDDEDDEVDKEPAPAPYTSLNINHSLTPAQIWTALTPLAPSTAAHDPGTRRVDIVLGSAGLDLFADCLFADFLTQTNLAHTVHFHGRPFPFPSPSPFPGCVTGATSWRVTGATAWRVTGATAWRVGGATRKDWTWLVNGLAHGIVGTSDSDLDFDLDFDSDPAVDTNSDADREQEKERERERERERTTLRTLGARWKAHERAGRWVFESHPFWGTAYGFGDMESEAPDLFANMARAAVVVVKRGG